MQNVSRSEVTAAQPWNELSFSFGPHSLFNMNFLGKIRKSLNPNFCRKSLNLKFFRVALECLFCGMFEDSKNTMDLLHSRISRSLISLLTLSILFTLSNSNFINLAAPYPCGKGAPRARNMRIIGGKPAFPGQFPWAVSLRKRVGSSNKFNHYCAGSLITAKHVVTAAHCLHKTTNDSWEVVAGEHRPGEVEAGEQIRKVRLVGQRHTII